MARRPVPEQVFLERQSYRRRRLMDAARLLPLAGALALSLPLLWAGPGDETAGTAAGGLYLFGVWTLLILAAAILSRRLIHSEPAPPTDRGKTP